MDGISNKDAEALSGWVFAANRWAEASQELVAAGTAFSTTSSELSTRLGAPRSTTATAAQRDLARLASELGMIGTQVDEETQIFRNRYLETAANLDEYRKILE